MNQFLLPESNPQQRKEDDDDVAFVYLRRGRNRTFGAAYLCHLPESSLAPSGR